MPYNSANPASALQYNYVTLNGTTATLGDSVNVPGGVDLVAKTDFTSATSVSVNNCFTARCENYALMVSLTASLNGQQIALRLRTGGVDSTASAYNTTYNVPSNASTLTTASIFAGNNFLLGHSGASGLWTTEIRMFKPAVVSTTGYTARTFTSYNLGGAANTYALWDFGGWNTSVAGYDGVSIINTGGDTMSGTLRVYGYQNG